MNILSSPPRICSALPSHLLCGGAAHNTNEVQEATEDTAAIDEQLTLINTEVDILDSIISNIYDSNPEKLHAWDRASRVERDPKCSKPATDEDGTMPPIQTPV